MPAREILFGFFATPRLSCRRQTASKDLVMFFDTLGGFSPDVLIYKALFLHGF